MRPARRRRPSARGAVAPGPHRAAGAARRRRGDPAAAPPAAAAPAARRPADRRLAARCRPYADALLRFAHAAVRARPASTEVFTIGTRLTRVTRELRLRDPDKALAASGSAIPDWSGGTRLGEVLKAFLDRWGQRGTARGAVVVVCSDGWERGGTELLAEQMARLRAAGALGRLGEPAQGPDRLRAADRRHGGGAALGRPLRRPGTAWPRSRS